MINRLDAKNARIIPKIMKEIKRIKRKIIYEAILESNSVMEEIGKDSFRDKYIIDHFTKLGFIIEDKTFFININFQNIIEDPNKCIDQEMKEYFKKYVNNPEITKHLNEIMDIIASTAEDCCVNTTQIRYGFALERIDVDYINIVIKVLEYLGYLINLDYKGPFVYRIKIIW